MSVAVLGTAAALALASGAHCTVMCGPLAAGACTNRGRTDRGEAARYLFARTASYALLGAVAASVGRPFVPARTATVVQLVVSVALAAILVRRALRSFGTKNAPLVRLRTSNEASGGRFARVFGWVGSVTRTGLGLGLASAMFPCGLLFAAVLVAATAGSPAMGAAAMIVFALLTAPFLVAALVVGDRAARWTVRSGGARRWAGAAITCLMALAMIAVPLAAFARARTPTPATTSSAASSVSSGAVPDGMPPDCPFHHRK